MTIFHTLRKQERTEDAIIATTKLLGKSSHEAEIAIDGQVAAFVEERRKYGRPDSKVIEGEEYPSHKQIAIAQSQGMVSACRRISPQGTHNSEVTATEAETFDSDKSLAFKSPRVDLSRRAAFLRDERINDHETSPSRSLSGCA